MLASVFAIARTSVHHSRTEKLEKGREADRLRELNSAKIVGTIRKGESALYIVIKNEGQAEARNIEICLDGMSYMEHKHVIRPRKIPVLGPGATYDLQIAQTDNRPLPSNLRIKWNDDTDEARPFSTALDWGF